MSLQDAMAPDSIQEPPPSRRAMILGGSSQEATSRRGPWCSEPFVLSALQTPADWGVIFLSLRLRGSRRRNSLIRELASSKEDSENGPYGEKKKHLTKWFHGMSEGGKKVLALNLVPGSMFQQQFASRVPRFGGTGLCYLRQPRDLKPSALQMWQPGAPPNNVTGDGL